MRSPDPPDPPDAVSAHPDAVRTGPWSIEGTIRPPIGHVDGYRLDPADGGTLTTSFSDWPQARADIKAAEIVPVVSATNLRATLAILESAVRRGYPRG